VNLRLPSLGEAVALATNYNLPNVGETQGFWAEETINDPSNPSGLLAARVQDNGLYSFTPRNIPDDTVCVTTPTN
jgi:hypothetical protein